MTTILDHASRALRALGVIGKGQVASGSDGEDALQHYQDMINDLPGLRKGRWTEVLLTSAAAYEASDGERINVQGYAATITLPTTYEDATGTTVPQRDLSRVQIIGTGHAQAGLWVYVASAGAWVQVDDLELSDDVPFGAEDDAGMVAMLAVELAPEFGEQATLSQVVIERAGRQLRSFRARFRRAVTVPVDAALTVMSDTGDSGMMDLAS